jgi:hypothetical protein
MEAGTLPPADAWALTSKMDPVLIYFVLRYLREKYPPSDPKSAGVAQRLVALTSTYDDVVKKSKQGEKDVIREWFDDSHEMHEFYSSPAQLIAVLVDKIES